MRLAAGIVGGFLVGCLLYILVSMLADTPQVWSLLAGWVIFGVWFARSRNFAWGRAWLSLCIGSFALPLASVVLSSRIAARVMSKTDSSAEQAGAAIGATFFAGAAGFIGFFLGVIFAILAYVSFRSAREVARAEDSASRIVG